MSAVLIGREKECKTLASAIAQKKNIVIFGEEGVGKSAILEEVLNGLQNLNRLYSPSSKTLKCSLLNFMRYAPFDKKTISVADTLALKKLFHKFISANKPEYIIFDQIENVEPKYYSFLVYLLEAGIPLIILSRGIEKKDIGHLRMSLFEFEKIQVTNFDRQTSDAMIDYLITELGIKITKKPDFKKELFRFSKGNPKIIKDLCFLARDAKYHRQDVIDVSLMDLDRRIAKAVH